MFAQQTFAEMPETPFIDGTIIVYKTFILFGKKLAFFLNASKIFGGNLSL
jgi:hypothetical protein